MSELKASHFYRLASGICFLLLFCSCSPKTYIPDAVQVPLITRQSELELSPYFCMEQFGGFGITGHYALTDHLFICGSYLNEKTSGTASSAISNNIFRYNFADAGAGYYHADSSHLRYGISGGFGKGSVIADYQDYNFFSTSGRYDINARFSRFSSTFYVGRAARVCEIGVAMRLSYITYDLYHFARTNSFTAEDFNDNSLPGNLLIEPALKMNLGYKFMKFTFQAGFSVPTGSEPGYQPYNRLVLSTGVYLKLFSDGGKWPEF